MDYYTNPAMSQSKLKDLKRSPKHFWVKYIWENREIEPTTDAMEFGKAVHACLFEHQKFIQEYMVAPSIDKRTKAGKLEFENFVSQAQDKNIITQTEMSNIFRIRDSILSKKTSRKLLNGGLAEHELFWLDTDTGIDCKAKLDYFIEPCNKFPNGIIIDLKTTINANASDFVKSIYNFGYYNQVAFYCNAVKTFYKTNDYPDFIFIPVEKTAPFECTFLATDKEMLNYGLAENNTLLELYLHCISTNHWVGYEDKIQYISLPEWVYKKHENRYK